MSTGHTSKTAMGAVRIALLAGASAAAIFAAGSANAQNVPVSPTPFQNGGTYVKNTGANNDPRGANIDTGVIPGLTPNTTSGAYVLTDMNGNTVSTSVTNAVGADGTPKTTTYQSEAPGANLVGTGGNVGMVLVNTTTGALAADPGSSFDTGGVPPAGHAWAPITNNDPTKTYQWVQATYNRESAAATAYVGTAANNIDNQYIIDANGALVSATDADAAGITATTNAANTAAILAAKGWTSVSQGAVDPKATASLLPSTDYAYNRATFAANGATVNHRAGQGTTTSVAGGVVYSNPAGNYTAIGPDGATFHGATVTVTDGAGSTTTITDGNISNTGTLTVGGLATLNGGLAVTGGTTTDTLTVTGATITNGITNNGNIKTTTLNTTGTATIGGQAFLTGGATVSNNLTVTPGTNVDMGGNRVQDVGTPIAGTDATNKAYVDRGLNKAYEGTAIALAISQPVFLPGQNFAIRAGWGGYEGQNALGVSAAGVVARNLFGYGSTLSLDGGVGVGSNNGVAGKAGFTVGFGGGAAPLK